MAYVNFLQSLFDEGRVVVPSPAPWTDDDLARGDALLSDFNARCRLEAPAAAPQLDLLAARWGAMNFYRACRFTVYRDVDAAAIDAQLDSAYDAVATPAIHWSVDLVFRRLPDLLKLVHGLAEADPLAKRILHWAHDWPLSSVGVADVGEVVVDDFIEHRCLATMYIDRIFFAGDSVRLADARVRRLAQAAVGAHLELASSLAPLLTSVEASKNAS